MVNHLLRPEWPCRLAIVSSLNQMGLRDYKKGRKVFPLPLQEAIKFLLLRVKGYTGLYRLSYLFPGPQAFQGIVDLFPYLEHLLPSPLQGLQGPGSPEGQEKDRKVYR